MLEFITSMLTNTDIIKLFKLQFYTQTTQLRAGNEACLVQHSGSVLHYRVVIDYRALRFIEDYIRNEILPWYGNTHTATAVTSHQMTLLREEARFVRVSSVRVRQQ